MANIFGDDWNDNQDGYYRPGVETRPRGPASTSPGEWVDEPYIGPGFTPWVDMWSPEGPNVSGTKPTDVPRGTRPLYNDLEWTNLPDAEKASYWRTWGQNGSGGGSYSGEGQSAYDFLGSGALFDDPSTQTYIDILTKYLDRLGGPLEIPGLSDYTSALQTRLGELSRPANIPEMDRLKKLLGEQADRPFEPNPELDAALRAISTRIGELNAPPFTALEEKGQEVQAFDQLERDKQEARRQVIERMAARGIGAGSGIIEAAIQKSDQFFDQLRSQRTGDLLEYRTDVGQQRKNQAVDLGIAAGGLRGDELERKDLYYDRKTGAIGTLAEIGQGEFLLNEARSDKIVDLSSILADLGFQQYGLDDNRGLRRVQLAATLPDLVERRLSLALNAPNGGSSSLMPFGSTLSNLLGQSQTARANAPRGTDYSGLFLGLGNILGNLMNRPK